MANHRLVRRAGMESRRGVASFILWDNNTLRQPFSMVEMRAFLLPVPHPQEIRVPQKSAAVTTVCSISKGIFNSGPLGPLRR